MITYFRRLFNWVKLFTIFIILTVFSYIVIGMLVDWLKPSYRFQPPEGRAVKVFSHENASQVTTQMSGWERLKFFFWTGE